MKKVAIIGAGIIVLLVITILLVYNFLLGPTGNSSDKIKIEVTKGSTYLSIASILKQNDLIKSELAYKLYIKLNSPEALEAGKYELTKKMGVKEIIKTLESGSNYNADVISLRVPEGKSLKDIATLAASVTHNKEADLLNLWDSTAFVDKVMTKYWFINDDVKKSGIKHPLEGYFFPSTYQLLNTDVNGEYIAYKFLDQMDKVLTKYKKEITSNKYNVHQLLTLASIVEKESILDVDRPIIAGVFYNRLNKNMTLGSDVTVGYALGETKLSYTSKDLAYNSPYNTYLHSGLPIGPIDNPGENSIKAAITPTTTDYLYFIADICQDGNGPDNKVYYSKTLSQHNTYVNKYLTCY